ESKLDDPSLELVKAIELRVRTPLLFLGTTCCNPGGGGAVQAGVEALNRGHKDLPEPGSVASVDNGARIEQGEKWFSGRKCPDLGLHEAIGSEPLANGKEVALAA